MAQRIEIDARAQATWHLLALDLPKSAVEAFTTPVRNQHGDYDYPLREALDLNDLNEEYVEVIKLADLEAIGLTNYMIEGHGVIAEGIEPDRDRLDALTGYLVAIHSAALEGHQTMLPGPELRHIGSYGEERPKVVPVNLSSDSAKGGGLDRPPRAPRAVMHWVWPVIGLVVLAYAIFEIIQSLRGQ